MDQRQSWFWPKKFFLAKKPMKVICTWRDFAMAPFYDSHLGTVAIAGSQMHSGVQMQPNLSSASRHSSRMESTNPCAKAEGGLDGTPPNPPLGNFCKLCTFSVPHQNCRRSKVKSIKWIPSEERWSKWLFPIFGGVLV